jgi:23S rRNA pseudouridine2605 synthase
MSDTNHDQPVRLNKLVAQATGQARRQVDELINKQRIKVDGKLAVLGQKVTSTQSVEIYTNGSWQKLNQEVKPETILFYKPIFCVTSRKAQNKDKTIYDFIPPKFHKLKPAGRLDYMSEGLLVMSLDGDLIQSLSHPSGNTQKIYLVGLKQKLTLEQIKILSSGVELDGYQLKPLEIEDLQKPNSYLQKFSYLKLQPNFCWYKFSLHEGRNNQIRKMVGLFGYKVLRLIRVKQGDYEVTPKLYEQKIIS